MMRLLGALGHSSGSSLAMLLGENTSPTSSELTAIMSIPDATFHLLTTLSKKASNLSLVLNPVYQYLASCKFDQKLDKTISLKISVNICDSNNLMFCYVEYVLFFFFLFSQLEGKVCQTGLLM